jgi:hypothetical protein
MTSDIIGYKYATLSVKFTPDSEVFQIYADTGYSRPLVDREWLSQNPSARINMTKATVIKGIASVQELRGWATFDIYIRGKVNGRWVLGKVTVNAWVTDNLEPLLLLGNAFLTPHGAIIDLPGQTITFSAINNLEVPINVYNRGTRVIRKVLAKKKVIISPGATVRVNTTYAALPLGRNYTMNACFNGVHDALTDHGNYVTYTNTTDKSQIIPRRTRLGVIRDFEEEGYYIVSQTNELNDNTTTNTPALPRSTKGAGITKPTEVPEKLLGNDVHVYTKNQTLADHIEAIVVKFQNY